ncbi:MAG TPA: FAD-dependent monooxygenase [Acidobacteriaceae bacterium]|nr:FAD-dependent monooxygenase [Acidobacteriaceae bacterium]
MSVERDFDVDLLIQGAGIGGLTLAIALIRKGYTVRIVERAIGLSEVGAGIWMAANPMQVFDRLGFSEKIIAAGWAVHRITLADYNGDILQQSDLSAVAKLFGFETVALHRAALQKALFEQLPPGVVTFEAEVQSLQQNAATVSVQLTNGSTLTAKMVVGADGIRSHMRTLASLGGAIRYSGSSSYRAIAKSTRLLPPVQDRHAYEIWGKGCRLGFSKINADDYYWYMTFDCAPDTTLAPADRRAHAESLCAQFFPQWTALLKNTPANAILQTDISDLTRLKTWSSARIFLIGDAAHASTPNLGQGGAMAVEDAYALTGAIEEAGLTPRAFELFEKQRRARVDWIVSTSWKIGRICHFRHPVLRSLRNFALSKLVSSDGEKQIRKLYSVG